MRSAKVPVQATLSAGLNAARKVQYMWLPPIPHFPFMCLNSSHVTRHKQLCTCFFCCQICICVAFLVPRLAALDLLLPSLTCAGLVPFIVPTALYFVNNNLAVHMQLEMDPATYQVHNASAHHVDVSEILLLVFLVKLCS